MQRLDATLLVVFILSFLFTAQADLPSVCEIFADQPSGQPQVEFCAYKSIDKFENFTNQYDRGYPFSTALCLAMSENQVIIPGSCGCPNSCNSKFSRGTCVSRGGVNTCQCQPGWAGRDCSIVICDNVNPCQNGGKCIFEKNIDVCACAQGYNLIDCSGKDKMYTKLPTPIAPQYKKDDFGDDHPLFDISTVATVRVYMKEDDLFSLVIGPKKTPFTVQSIHINNKRISLANNGTIQKSGAASSSFAKKSFRFKFTDEFMGVKTMKLKGAEFDSSFIREAMSIAVARSMGIPVGRSGYAALYINDMFRGVYILLEDIKKPFFKSRFGTKDGAYCDGLGCEHTSLDFLKLRQECVLQSGNRSRINELMDVDMYLKSVAVDAMTGNWDGWKNNNNIAFYQPKANEKFTPFRFDLDASWGFDFAQPQQSSIDVLQYSSNWRTFCSHLTQDATLRATYIRHIQHIADTWLAPKGPAVVFATELHQMLLPFGVQDNWHALDFDHTPKAFLESLNVDVSEPVVTQAIMNFISTRYATALQQIGV